MPGQRPQTLLERAFPVKAVSRVARADRFSPDPVYSVHRWWARRPPATFRALLLAAQLSSEFGESAFWDAFASETSVLRGKTVADPFVGGATSLVEASRLGATVLGGDIDPLAVLIATQELKPLPSDELNETADELLRHLTKSFSHLYASRDGVPLHYFFIRRVSCPRCNHPDYLFRSLILARDLGRAGAVVRDADVTAFCPQCLRIHQLRSHRSHLLCCGRRRKLDFGTFVRGRYQCPSCDVRSSHAELKTGVAARVLVAVETGESGVRRHIRPPSAQDHTVLSAAADLLKMSPNLSVPRSRIPRLDRDGRPQIYGIRSIAEMFSDRQLIVFSEGFRWLKSQNCRSEVRQALALALSNALTTNNLFCGYATDYGRVSPLFTVRSYSLPALAVELNALHAEGGRGTIPATVRRLLRAQESAVQRHSWNPARRRVTRMTFPARGEESSASIERRDAREAGWPRGSVHICLTDPPYFDYISYSDLSYFYRAWLKSAGFLDAMSSRAKPLYPSGHNGTQDFTEGLAHSLKQMRTSITEGGLVVFTYHSTNPEAWSALNTALSRARLTVTAAFPLWADAKSVGHDKVGNCEWDICFVCRPSPEGWRWTRDGLDEWVKLTNGFAVGTADKRSWEYASSVISQLRVEATARARASVKRARTRSARQR